MAKVAAAIDKPVLICETGYPATADFGGQFADWKQAVDGYPLSAEGQAKWLADFTATIRRDSRFCGAYYFSPEWYGGGLWDAYALFDARGVARPAARAFDPVK